jgi:hypothetical protein
MWLINTTNLAVSTTSEQLSDVVVYDGTLYAVSGSTLVACTGSPTGAVVETGSIEYDGGRLSTVHQVTLNYDAAEAPTATIIYGDTEHGPRVAQLSDRRIKASRGLQADRVTIRINSEGLDQLESIEVDTTPHPRRR